jgi:hypothetical protein
VGVRPFHPFRVVGDGLQVAARCRVRLAAADFPVAQRLDVQTIPRRELFAGEGELLAQGADVHGPRRFGPRRRDAGLAEVRRQRRHVLNGRQFHKGSAGFDHFFDGAAGPQQGHAAPRQSQRAVNRGRPAIRRGAQNEHGG